MSGAAFPLTGQSSGQSSCGMNCVRYSCTCDRQKRSLAGGCSLCRALCAGPSAEDINTEDNPVSFEHSQHLVPHKTSCAASLTAVSCSAGLLTGAVEGCCTCIEEGGAIGDSAGEGAAPQRLQAANAGLGAAGRAAGSCCKRVSLRAVPGQPSTDRLQRLFRGIQAKRLDRQHTHTSFSAAVYSPLQLTQ
jgi:hypothetical protein